ncbi:serine/threonine protein kinase [Nocardioides panacisoli]|uniref:serine/threonine-protein kinase n=1 Tax=Nocardioides panacisoli TaxID=627624 RepID=UPI001C6320FE|nr:serine/threonine-protein kinase [Nocardioides panacisoli]QYJ05502.1 serine/threonine protein kinase [Nocardioides panacisoli]
MTMHKVADRYTLRHEVGRGGAGAVWLAVDEILGREVALKRIGLPPGAEDVDVERAEREARLAAQVTHANVVAVFDFVAGSDEHWLVMEYVDGTNLARMVRERGPLPPSEAARILAEAARGLAAAHALGIVHRDVKPSNILLGRDGAVKLSDFGIARGTSDVSLTQTGLVTGSPAYLAPEIATGASASPASDVWSLGATLFHALSGAPPYQGQDATTNPVATLYRIAHEAPPTVETEPWAAAVLGATMSHRQDQRPTAEELAGWFGAPETVPAPAPSSDTQTIPQVEPAPAPPAGRRHGRRVLVAMAAVAALVLAVVGGLALGSLGGDDADTAGGGVSSSPTSTTPEPSQPTAAELEDFARTYVQTASSDPAAGFEMLTADYQAASPQYREFWGSVSDPEILEVTGDPEALQVVYTYEYAVADQGRRTEGVGLQLVQQGDDLLIDGDFRP